MKEYGPPSSFMDKGFLFNILIAIFGYSFMYTMTIIPVIIGLAIFLKYYKKA